MNGGLRALGLLLAYGALTVGWMGGGLFGAPAFFFFLQKWPYFEKNQSQGAKWTVSEWATNGPLTIFGGVWQITDFCPTNKTMQSRCLSEWFSDKWVHT